MKIWYCQVNIGETIGNLHYILDDKIGNIFNLYYYIIGYLIDKSERTFDNVLKYSCDTQGIISIS